MKTLKAIMAVAMIMILASCGGKSFDYDKADKLCEKYHKDGFDDKDWNEFANLYKDMCEYEIYVQEQMLKNDIKSGMTMDEVEEITRNNREAAKIQEADYYMSRVLSDSRRRDRPDKANKTIDKAQGKFNKESERVYKELMKKIGD